MIEVIRASGYDDMSGKAADILCAQVLLKPRCVLGLATGGTPVGAYRVMAGRAAAGNVDFSRARSVNLDEYVGLSPQHGQSYRYFMQSNLFDHINIRPENTHVPNGLAQNAEEECLRYDALIDGLGGIDLQLLGIGRNGHVGFNEPCDAFVPGTHRVALADNTIAANARFFASEAEVPRFAYTMGIAGIMQARRVLVAACGADKAAALRAALRGPVTPLCPASILQLHPRCTVVADEAALAEL